MRLTRQQLRGTFPDTVRWRWRGYAPRERRLSRSQRRRSSQKACSFAEPTATIERTGMFYRGANGDNETTTMLGEPFDPTGELAIDAHFRPHWSQAGAVVFITFSNRRFHSSQRPRTLGSAKTGMAAPTRQG